MQKDDAISRQAAIGTLMPIVKSASLRNRNVYSTAKRCLFEIEAMPAVDAVPVVRCKDCKHRPTGDDKDDLEFPDEICPCQCEDFWYSWKPADNWFCGNGERKDGE